MAVNNTFVFNAAVSGAMAGCTNSRWFTSTTDVDYNGLVECACAFASALDTSLPTWPGPGTNEEIALCVAVICHGFWSGRILTSQFDTDYAEEAQALAAMIRQTTTCFVGGA